jgi:RNA polymerase sigma-70 factor (ECF subfamily)
VNAPEQAIEIPDLTRPFDFETLFHAHYRRIARTIARVVRDHARAEEIAVEVFWKFWRSSNAPKDDRAGGWLYRTAVRMALDELRKNARRIGNESEAKPRPVETPEAAHAAAQERDRVRLVLASLDARESELLLLRSDGLSYNEIAAALELNPASVGTLLTRAQQAFRKEYQRQ